MKQTQLFCEGYVSEQITTGCSQGLPLDHLGQISPPQHVSMSLSSVPYLRPRYGTVSLLVESSQSMPPWAQRYRLQEVLFLLLIGMIS